MDVMRICNSKIVNNNLLFYHDEIFIYFDFQEKKKKKKTLHGIEFKPFTYPHLPLYSFATIFICSSTFRYPYFKMITTMD